MTDGWIEDVLYAIGLFFLNPLFWLILVTAVMLGYFRVKRERHDFNVRKLPGITEFKQIVADSWVPGLVVSILVSGVGIVVDVSWIILFSVVMAFMLMSFFYQWGSPIYTATIALVVLLVGQQVGTSITFLGWSPADAHDAGTLAVTVSIVAGILMVAEGVLIRKSAVRYTSPRLEKTSRGLRAATFKAKQIWLLPVVFLIPGDLFQEVAPYWPQFTLGEQSFSFVPVPIVIGFSQIARKHYPDTLFPKLGTKIMWSGIAVVAIGICGLYEPLLGWVSLLFGVLVRITLSVVTAVGERRGGYAASPSAKGVVVAGVLPGSPAEKLGLLPGEIIRAVNGMQVANEKDLYDAIQVNAAHCRLQVADRNGEVRLMQQVLYRHDHYRLGLLLVR